MSHTIQNPPPETFDRHQYHKDEVHLLRPTHKYWGQITQDISPSNSPHASERHIDDAVCVMSVDRRTRQAAMEHFTAITDSTTKELQACASDRRTAIAATIGGGSLGIGAVVAFSATVLTPLVTLPIFALGFATAITGFKKWQHNQQAFKELDTDINVIRRKRAEWNDPIYTIIEQRKRVGSDGFQYVFSNNLKHTIVHPEEVKALWLNDFTKLLNNGIDPLNIFKNDLLGNSRVKYAWDNNTLPSIEMPQRTISATQVNKMAALYKESHSAYRQFEKEISLEMDAIEKRRLAQHSEIAALRTQWLMPAERMYALGIQEAEYIYNTNFNAFARERDLEIAETEKAFRYVINDPLDAEEAAYKLRLNALCRQAVEDIRQNFQNHPAVIEMQRAYDKDRRMCSLLYNQSKMVVDGFFDQRLRQLDSDVALAKTQVEQQRFNGLQHFSNLLERILHPRDEHSLYYLTISSPSIARNWHLSNLSMQPAWHEVYGRLPTFHSTFASDISEAAWNRFWGNQGLGRFASYPTKSWHNLFTDRSHFPFQDNWFNIKMCAQQAQRPSYRRTIVVPPPPFSNRTRCQQPVRNEPQRFSQRAAETQTRPLPTCQTRERPQTAQPSIPPRPPRETQRVPVGSARERNPASERPSQERPAPTDAGTRVSVGYGNTKRR